MLDLIKYIVGTFAENAENAEYRVEENGNIVNSVNYPACELPRTAGATRITVLHKNIPNVLTSITSIISEKGINIENMMNKSKGDFACTILDISEHAEVAEDIKKIEGVIKARIIK